MNGDHFLYDSADLSINSWDRVGGALIADSGKTLPGGDKLWEITSPLPNSYRRQNIINPKLANKPINLQAKVEPGTGTITNLYLWFLNVNTSLAINNVRFNLSDRSSSVIAGNVIPGSNQASDTENGRCLISFSALAPPNTNRCIVGLHYGGKDGSVLYGHVNLREWDGLSPPPYEATTNIHHTPGPAKYLSNLDYTFNPSVPADLAAWDCGEIGDHVYDVVAMVPNPGQLQAAVNVAQSAPSKKHRINLEFNNVEEDINLTVTADFIAAGGLLVITTANGEMLHHAGQLRIRGGRGCAWFYYKNKKEFDQYIMQASQENLHSGISFADGNWCLKNHETGNGFNPDGDPMLSCIGIYYLSTDVTSSLLIDRVDSRNNFSFIRRRGPGRLVIKNEFGKGVIEDEVYANNNVSAGEGNKVAIWMQNVCTCSPAALPLFFLCCNTRNEAWATSGFYPFVLGELVEQVNPDGVFRGKVHRIFLGDGLMTAPRMGTAKSISGAGTNWRGDIVYIMASPESETYLHAEHPVVGITSGAAFTPTKTVTSGASSGHDAGMLLAILHTDVLQWGASNDDPKTTYRLARFAVNAIAARPIGGETQGAIPNAGVGQQSQFYERFSHIAVTAQRASDISSGEFYSSECTHTRAPLGTVWQRKMCDPGPGYSAGTIPSISVRNPLQSYSSAPFIRNVVSGQRVVLDAVRVNAINNSDWYPFLFPVREVRSNAAPDADNSHEVIFGRPLERYADGEVIENVPRIPHNAPRVVAMRLVHNWTDFYREPVYRGGWDYTTDLSGTGWPPAGFFGKNWNPGRIPHIRFSEWWEQSIQAGAEWVPPRYSATDGLSDLTCSVAIDMSAVDTKAPGIYYPRFWVTNADGNTYETFSLLEVTPAPDPGPEGKMKYIFFCGVIGFIPDQAA